MNETESLITKFYDKKFEACLDINRRLLELAESCQAVRTPDMERYHYMFIKSVISCMTNLFSEHCSYTMPRKLKQIQRIVADEAVVKSCGATIRNSLYFLILQNIIRSRIVPLNYAMAKSITYFSRKAPGAFVRIKHNK